MGQADHLECLYGSRGREPTWRGHESLGAQEGHRMTEQPSDPDA